MQFPYQLSVCMVGVCVCLCVCVVVVEVVVVGGERSDGVGGRGVGIDPPSFLMTSF